jgi:cytochrome c biogenesis protein CcdA
MINDWLESLSSIISKGSWIAPLLALLAGALTSITPCALTGIPLVIGYVGGNGSMEPHKAFKLSAVFALGTALTFTVLGVIASLAGKFIGTSSPWWYIALGILMVLMALQTWEVYDFIPSTFLISKSTGKGYIGAFAAGILGGIFSSPCATPVLIVLLAVVSSQGSLVWGLLLFLLYSAGHSVIVLAAGTSVGFVRKITASDKYGKANKIIKTVMGSIVLLIAFYMFYLGF